MEDLELINRLMVIPNLTIKTRTFLEDLRFKCVKYDSLTENQKKALYSICGQNGISIMDSDQQSKIQIIESKRYEEIKGSCGKCEAGILLTRLHENNNLYAWLCDCDVGAKRPEQFPKWNDIRWSDMHRVINPMDLDRCD